MDVYKSERHGNVNVPNPYEWLEHDSKQTQDWVSAQEAFTRSYLDKNPDRQSLEDTIRQNTNYAKFSAPSLKDDGRWYWSFNTGLQAQAVIHRSKDDNLPLPADARDPCGEVFFDPNLLSTDGTSALVTTAFSPGGKYFAYAISRAGSDLSTIYVRPTSAPFRSQDGQPISHDSDAGRLKDELNFVKFSGITWTHDAAGFFYMRFPSKESASDNALGDQTKTDENAMLYYHKVGTPQSEDILLLKDPENPTWMWGTEISEVDGKYLILTISRDTARKYLTWIADLTKGPISEGLQWDKVVNTFDAKYEYIANDGSLFYFLTNKDAPRSKLVSVDLADPPEDRVFKDVIPTDDNAFLEYVLAINNDYLAVVYKRHVKDEIYLYNFKGERLKRIAEDFIGAASLYGRRKQPWFWATLEEFTTPSTVARYDFEESSEDKKWSIYRKTFVEGLNSEDFLAEQVWYKSKDDTPIPMFIVRHKDTKYDGTAPALQYGYGGFTISINPFFSAGMLTFIQRYGGLMAVPNIRGGGEFGEEWHQGGMLERKQNCFDDFLAASTFLVQRKYAAPGKVILNGGSNGGLLVAACVNQAPEGLIGAAIAEVGVLDLLKFADFTIGRAWTSDYGNPHDPHDFDFIYPISPVHNVPTDKILPPTLLMTADHDDRVVPLHSFKHAATLQHTLPDNPHPLLLRIEKNAGHGAGKSTDKRIVEAADKWGFAVQSLGLAPKELPEDSKL